MEKGKNKKRKQFQKKACPDRPKNQKHAGLKDRLLAKIRDKKAVVSVIGLGYVGLPLVLEFIRAGFKVIELFKQRGAEVDYNAPYIPKPPKTRKWKLDKDSVPLTARNLAAYDYVIIATEHSDYDAAFIHQHARLIVDTRNLMGKAGIKSEKIIKA